MQPFFPCHTEVLGGRRDIPYVGSTVTAATVRELGDILSADEVMLWCPPGALPENTGVTMMVADVEQGFMIRGEMHLSPLVAIGSDKNGHPTEPLKLFLPLQVQPGLPVEVVASDTMLSDPPNWVPVPAADVTMRELGVDVLIRHFGLFQARCGRVQVVTPGGRMHFSVSSDDIGGGQFVLCVCCSSDPEYCFQAPAGQRLVNRPDHTTSRPVSLLPTMEVAVKLKTTDGSIIQRHAYLNNEEKEGVLDASFVVKQLPVDSAEERPLEDRGENFSWLIEPSKGAAFGNGYLEARCQVPQCSEMEESLVEKWPRSRSCRIPFRIPFGSVGCVSFSGKSVCACSSGDSTTAYLLILAVRCQPTQAFLQTPPLFSVLIFQVGRCEW